MEKSKPKELVGVDLAGKELVSVSLDVKKMPDPNGSGFVNLTLSFHAPRFYGATKDKGPKAFVLEVEATCKAWSGQPLSNDKQPPDDQLLMVCQLKVDAHYHVTRNDLKEQEIADCNWFFHPQLTILATDALRSLLKDTRFASIPIGLPLGPAPEGNMTKGNTPQ